MYTRFTASQSVELAVPEQAVPIQHYLRQPQRVVYALASSSKLEALGDDRFRLMMRPLKFMHLSIQPVVDLQVWATADSSVQLKSIGCEIRGTEYINQRFALNLEGKLSPCLLYGKTYLKGRADLEVQVELPPALQFTPRPLLEAAGNSLLASVLMTIKQRLMHQLLVDYRRWASTQEKTAAESAQVGGLFSNRLVQ